MKATILSGLAAALLGTATGTAALAQYDARYGNGPPESTPAEMQQTDQLNQQSGNAAAADLAAQAQNNAQYQNQQQQYQQQLQSYQTRQQDYDARRQGYDYDRARYYATWPVYAPYEWGYYPYTAGYPYVPAYPYAPAYPPGPAYPYAPDYYP